MQTKLAIVQVHTLRLVLVVRKQTSEPVCKEHSIGVRFHCPLGALEITNLDYVLPHRNENIQVECRPELTTFLATEVSLDRISEQTLRNFNSLVRKDRIFLAIEDTDVLGELVRQECHFV